MNQFSIRIVAMIASVAPSIIRRRSGLLLINNPILYNCAHKKTTSLIAMYGLNSRAGHLAGIFENNDQTYSVENSRPFIPTKETHANDDHHGHAEHNPDVYHFEVNGPQDVFCHFYCRFFLLAFPTLELWL